MLALTPTPAEPHYGNARGLYVDNRAIEEDNMATTGTVKELAQYLGRSGHYQIQGMRIVVRVVDARISFGQVQLEIAPYSGSGSTWVDQGSVILSVEKEGN